MEKESVSVEVASIPTAKIREAYKNSDTLTKRTLEDLYGLEFFTKKEFPASVAEVMDDDWRTTWDANSPMDCYAILREVIKRINGDWEPDWSDQQQPKYYLWFRLNPAFGLYYVGYSYGSSRVPSRLCFRTKELALKFTENPEFVELYKTYLTK